MTLNEKVKSWRVTYSEKGVILYDSEGENLVTNEGFNNLLNILFSIQAQNAFYIGLVDNSGFTAFATTDTAAQIGGSNGWAEITGYAESTRQVLTCVSAVSQATSNAASVANFTMSGSGTAKGFFVGSASAKSATTGFLLNEAAFTGGNITFTAGGVIAVTCNYTAANCS